MSAPAVEAVVPQRRRIVVGEKVGRGPLVVQMSEADKKAHDAASYVRPARPLSMTEAEREELARKLAEVNKRSSGTK